MGNNLISLLTSAIGALPSGVLIFKGTINVPADFPTLVVVQNGWTYFIGTNVTDNDATKTNTGQSFLAGDEIAWNGSSWSLVGSTALWTDDGTDVATVNSPRNVKGNTLESTVATGTAPLTVASTTVVANLNSDTVDGFHMDQSVLIASSPTVIGLTLSGLTTVGGIVQTDGAGVLSSSVTLPDGTLAITQSPGDNSTKLATTAYADAAVLIESIWDRNVAGFIFPQNVGDDLNMLQGSIYTIDPSNTSGTKSYQIVQTMTGVVPASEHARIDLYGLFSGSERVVYNYAGASNSHNWTGQDYVYNNDTTTVSQHLYKTSLDNVGGTGIILEEFFGLNSGPAEYQYTQIGHIIETNTASSEDGSMAFSVSENGSMTEYLRLNGLTKSIIASKPFLTARWTTAQLAAVTKVDGMIAYDTDEGNLQTVHDAGWTPIITADGNTSLDANWNIGTHSIVGDTPFVSEVATGTAPLTVASQTLVDNLNADFLDGQHGSYYAQDSLVVHLAGAEAITGVKTFAVSAIPVYAAHPTFLNDLEFVDKKYVDDSILVESIWDRNVAGFIFPQNAGDNLNMLQGTIYTVDPSNTSGTKSYEISQTLTGVVPASEHASTIFEGLSQGAQKTFMTYLGASNTIEWGGENWTFDNIVGTVGQTLVKVNISATGGSGFYFDQVFGRNAVAAETIYYQDRAIIGSNSAGAEDGIHVFDVIENGSQTEYMRLDGVTQQVETSKPLQVTGGITSVTAGLDGFLSLNNASSVEKVKLDTNGISYFAGGDVEIRGNELFLDNTQAINFSNAAVTANATIKMLAGDILDIRAPASAGMTLACPLDFVVDCEQDLSLECVGDMTFDAVNAAADSVINLTNSDGTFNTKFQVNGVEIVGANSKVNGPLINSIVYTDDNTDLAGVTMGAEDQPILSDGAAAPKPKFGTLRHAPSVITAAGATPVDSDVSSWNDDTHGIVVGTGGRVWFTFKNATDVYYAEATAN